MFSADKIDLIHHFKRYGGHMSTATNPVQFQPLWFDLLGVGMVALGITGVRSYYKATHLSQVNFMVLS